MCDTTVIFIGVLYCNAAELLRMTHSITSVSAELRQSLPLPTRPVLSTPAVTPFEPNHRIRMQQTAIYHTFYPLDW